MVDAPVACIDNGDDAFGADIHAVIAAIVSDDTAIDATEASTNAAVNAVTEAPSPRLHANHTPMPAAALPWAWRVDGYRAWLHRVDSMAWYRYGLSADMAVALAVSDGLVLVGANNRAGFAHVVCRGNAYNAQVKYRDGNYTLGSFSTPEEAALCVAWWLRNRTDTDTSSAASTMATSHHPMSLPSYLLHPDEDTDCT